MQIKGVWDTLIFLMNGFVFILIGLQLTGILKHLSGYGLGELIFYGLVVAVSTILIRILWVFTSASISNLIKRLRRTSQISEEETVNRNFWKNVLVVSWTGTRGLISMATALALPLTLFNGAPFVQRHLIIFLSFVVVFITLVVQGLSLPVLIRLLKIKKSEDHNLETKQLQLSLLRSTLYFIDHDCPGVDETIKRELIKKYSSEIKLLIAEVNINGRIDDEGDFLLAQRNALQETLIKIKEFQRDLLSQLHKNGEFSDIAVREVEKDMDIDELKLNQTISKPG
jgi:CPA1 family monovalent cation:H+ antiporter